MDDLFNIFCVDLAHTSPRTSLLQSSTSRPMFTSAEDSNNPYDFGLEQSGHQNQHDDNTDNNNATDDNTNNYIAAQTPSIPPSATCSPDILYGNYQPESIFQPAPATALWPIDNFSVFSDNYVTSAPLTNTISAPTYLAEPGNASSFDITNFGISQTWPTSNSPLDWNSTMMTNSSLPPPAVVAQHNIHFRSCSQPTLSQSAPMLRQFTSASGSNEASEDDRWPTVPTLSPSMLQRRTRSGRMTIAPSRTFPMANERTPARQTRPARASTTTEISQSSSSSYLSIPTSPDATRQQAFNRQGRFTCPLSSYGCGSRFSSKSEWKRHVNTKHLKSGYYLCELCPEDDIRAKYQSSRKDLFTQHIWRVHIQTEEQAKQAKAGQQSVHHVHPHQASVSLKSHSSTDPSPSASASASTKRSSGRRRPSTSTGSNITESVTNRYGDIYTRDWIQQRQFPTNTFCVFCHETFHGNNATEMWLEHVGRQHFTATSGSTSGGRGAATGEQPTLTQTAWADDATLRAWLVRYSEIVWDDRRGRYVLQSIMAAANLNREDWSGSQMVFPIAEEADADAEGEVDFEVEGENTFCYN